jgi:hypothetical protein
MVLVYQVKNFQQDYGMVERKCVSWAFHSFNGSDVLPVYNETAVPAKEP